MIYKRQNRDVKNLAFIKTSLAKSFYIYNENVTIHRRRLLSFVPRNPIPHEAVPVPVQRDSGFFLSFQKKS